MSVLFVFLWLTVCCVSGLLTSFRGCSQAKESKTKPSCTRMGCLDQREGKGGRKGTDPPSLHSMQPCSRPHINSTIHMSPLIRDTGILLESLTMEFTLSGLKIPFLCLIDGFESLSLCSEAMDLRVINSDYQYPGWLCYLISIDLSFHDLCTGVWIESPGKVSSVGCLS